MQFEFYKKKSLLIGDFTLKSVFTNWMRILAVGLVLIVPLFVMVAILSWCFMTAVLPGVCVFAQLRLGCSYPRVDPVEMVAFQVPSRSD